MNNSDDAYLLQRLQTSNESHDAFKELIVRYQEKLYWHIRRLVVSHEDANDVLQNTFMCIWNGLKKFKGESGLYTWMYRIATNECFHFLKKRKKHGVISLDELKTKLTDKVKAEKNFNSNQIEWRLQLALQNLPPKQRLVFTLRYYDEMPYAAISKILHTTKGSLKASYHLAAQKVQRFIVENA